MHLYALGDQTSKYLDNGQCPTYRNVKCKVMGNSSNPFLTHVLFVKKKITLKSENKKKKTVFFSVGNVHHVQ
jgi:hypothetical protein